MGRARELSASNTEASRDIPHPALGTAPLVSPLLSLLHLSSLTIILFSFGELPGCPINGFIKSPVPYML